MRAQSSQKNRFGFEDAVQVWVQTSWRSGTSIRLHDAVSAFKAEFPDQRSGHIERCLRDAAKTAGVPVVDRFQGIAA